MTKHCEGLRFHRGTLTEYCTELQTYHLKFLDVERTMVVLICRTLAWQDPPPIIMLKHETPDPPYQVKENGPLRSKYWLNTRYKFYKIY